MLPCAVFLWQFRFGTDLNYQLSSLQTCAIFHTTISTKWILLYLFADQTPQSHLILTDRSWDMFYLMQYEFPPWTVLFSRTRGFNVFLFTPTTTVDQNSFEPESRLRIFGWIRHSLFIWSSGGFWISNLSTFVAAAVEIFTVSMLSYLFVYEAVVPDGLW